MNYFQLVENLSQKDFFSRDLILVCKLNPSLSGRIGDEDVFISEFVLAKVLGYIKHLKGHPEVSKSFLLRIPFYLNNPDRILMRPDRPNERYIICGDPWHRVVLEIRRGGGVTEINTIHLIRESTFKKLEEKCIRL